MKRVLPPRSRRQESRGSDSDFGSKSSAGYSSESGVGISSWAGLGKDSTASVLKKSNLGMDSAARWGTKSESRQNMKSKKNHQRTTATGHVSVECDQKASTSTESIKNGIIKLFSGGKVGTTRGKSNWKRLKGDFMEEMRIMSKLRHPCVVTVMGKFANTRTSNIGCISYSYT